MAGGPAIATRTGTWLATRGSGLVGIESLADAAGLHPEVVRRLSRLGLVEASGGTRAMPLFRREDAPLLARAARLRRDLGLNYAGAVLACELLARIDELERQLTETRHEVIAWTRTV
jgi:DNA-binding transcriptional MerR regulator